MATVTLPARTKQAKPRPSPDPVRAIFDRLAAPFDPSEVRERPGSHGEYFAYITACTARCRLNAVLGPDGWECSIEPNPDSVVCRLTIHLPDGRSLTRSAIGGYPASMNDDPENQVKAADSDAFKRAAVLFGVGAYLYDDEPPPHTEIALRPAPSTNGRSLANVTTGDELFTWARSRGMLPALVAAGRRLGLPRRIVDWTADQAEQALAELV